MSNEQQYFDALKAIATGYQTPSQLRRDSEKQYGLSFEESIEMSYENIIESAKFAIHGKRRPKVSK